MKKLFIAILMALFFGGVAFGSFSLNSQFQNPFNSAIGGDSGRRPAGYAGTYWGATMTAYWDTAMTGYWDTAMDSET